MRFYEALVSAEQAPLHAFDQNFSVYEGCMPCLLYTSKANQAKKFLAGGDKVKASVRFRGREMAHPEMGRTLLERFIEACAEVGSVDKPPKMEGRSLAVFIAPKTTK